VCSLVFEAEPSAPGAMRRPPRPRNEPLFGPGQIALALLQGAIVLGGVLGLYVWNLGQAAEDAARAAALIALVTANLTLALADVAGMQGSIVAHRRRLFWAIALAAAAALTAALLITPAADAFQLRAPTPAGLALALVVGVAAGGWRFVVPRRLAILGLRDTVPVTSGKPSAGKHPSQTAHSAASAGDPWDSGGTP
jgi:Ca2+-transporting ATPase